MVATHNQSGVPSPNNPNGSPIASSPNAIAVLPKNANRSNGALNSHGYSEPDLAAGSPDDPAPSADASIIPEAISSPLLKKP